MKIKSLFVRGFAKKVSKKIDLLMANALSSQSDTLDSLISKGSKTIFGQEHGFDSIRTFADFQSRVPIRDYEGLRPYIDRIVNGESSVLWPGTPAYLAKTSGTTSGIKYIPISSDAIDHHVSSARNALFYYSNRYNDYTYLDGKMIFLSGSPALEETAGIPTGRLSGIVNHQVPTWLRRSQLPSYETNVIPDWEEKLSMIIQETKTENMTLISGIPPWVVMYYESLLEKTGAKTIRELFPSLSMFVYGGVDYRPYKAKIDQLVGAPLASIETYPASEGFIAYQDDQQDSGLLLNLQNGIYYEFVPLDQIHLDTPTRLTLADVREGEKYVLILNTTSGLWGYNLGDVVEFSSTQPYRIIVVGRTEHFISAFGEHVIAREIENAMLYATSQLRIVINEYTVAPKISPHSSQASSHEWLVEMEHPTPEQLEAIADLVDTSLQEQNIYYRDLRAGKILDRPTLTSLPPKTFLRYLRSAGKLGGQNKVPRLSNDRSIADVLLNQDS